MSVHIRIASLLQQEGVEANTHTPRPKTKTKEAPSYVVIPHNVRDVKKLDPQTVYKLAQANLDAALGHTNVTQPIIFAYNNEHLDDIHRLVQSCSWVLKVQVPKVRTPVQRIVREHSKYDGFKSLGMSWEKGIENPETLDTTAPECSTMCLRDMVNALLGDSDIVEPPTTTVTATVDMSDIPF